MAQNYVWPAVSVTATNPSIAPNGQSPSATSSTLVAGQDPSGAQQPLQTDVSGNLLVALSPSPPSTQDVNLTEVGGAAVSLGQKLQVASIPVVLPSDGTLPLPTGAATAANQVSEITELTSIAGSTSSLDSKTIHVDTDNVTVVSSALPSGAATAANQATQITEETAIAGSTASLDSKTVHVDTDNVTVISSALPSGAATSALQTSGNSSLTSILANQTNGTQVTSVNNFPATQPVSGTVTVVQPTAANLNATVVGTVTADAGTGTFAVSAASLPLPTGAATSALQTTGNTSLSSILTNQTNGTQTAVVSQPTAANLNATVVGTINAKAATPTALTITQAAVAVGTSAVRLTVSGSAPSATRVLLVITPDSLSTAKFYIGSSSVTPTSSTRGPEITAGQSFIANSDAGDYWIVSDTAAQTVYVMEQQ